MQSTQHLEHALVGELMHTYQHERRKQLQVLRQQQQQQQHDDDDDDNNDDDHHVKTPSIWVTIPPSHIRDKYMRKLWTSGQQEDYRGNDSSVETGGLVKLWSLINADACNAWTVMYWRETVECQPWKPSLLPQNCTPKPLTDAQLLRIITEAGGCVRGKTRDPFDANYHGWPMAWRSRRNLPWFMHRTHSTPTDSSTFHQSWMQRMRGHKKSMFGDSNPLLTSIVAAIVSSKLGRDVCNGAYGMAAGPSLTRAILHVPVDIEPLVERAYCALPSSLRRVHRVGSPTVLRLKPTTRATSRQQQHHICNNTTTTSTTTASTTTTTTAIPFASSHIRSYYNYSNNSNDSSNGSGSGGGGGSHSQYLDSGPDDVVVLRAIFCVTAPCLVNGGRIRVSEPGTIVFIDDDDWIQTAPEPVDECAVAIGMFLGWRIIGGLAHIETQKKRDALVRRIEELHEKARSSLLPSSSSDQQQQQRNPVHTESEMIAASVVSMTVPVVSSASMIGHERRHKPMRHLWLPLQVIRRPRFFWEMIYPRMDTGNHNCRIRLLAGKPQAQQQQRHSTTASSSSSTAAAKDHAQPLSLGLSIDMLPFQPLALYRRLHYPQTVAHANVE